MQASCDGRSHARGHSAKRHRSSSPARLPAPLTPAARSLRRRSAHQSRDLEEAVLHVPNKLVNSEDRAHQLALCSMVWIVCSPACILTSPTSTSMSSELGWATYITKERFLMPKPQLQQAAALVIMLDIHSFRHTGAATSRWPASSRRAAAAAQRSARGPHAPRSSTRARIAATSDASDATNGIFGRCARCVGI